MNILISNDDGFKSIGIKILTASLSDYGDTFVISPSCDISASSSCLSVHDPVNIRKVDDNEYIVMGTPADCVHIGSLGILRKFPDIVFSGINFGSNLGDDVVYSGTVGAAIEGRYAKYGSFALSITSKNPKYKKDIDKKCKKVIEYIFTKLIKHKSIFNINIPDIPVEKIKGFRITKLGKREISKRAKKMITTKQIKYNIGPVGEGIFKTATDFNAIRDGYISVTPISIDMTNMELYKKLK